MNITPNLHQPTKPQKCQEVIFSDLSLKSSRGRDVVIINPYSKGSGDEALAKKIANIALDEGCRVTISPLDALSENSSSNNHNQKYQSYSIQDESPHNISNLTNPLFIIAPVSIASITDIEQHLINMCEKFNFPRKDAIIIEEMDLLTGKDRALENYDAMLKKIGFANVSVNRLGFGDGAIGYIPTDEKTINDIKGRFEGELIRLLDSYNASLSSDNSYHLGYISSDCIISGTQVFIGNTLCETMADERDATFIMSLREFNPSRTPVLIEGLTYILTSKDNIDYPSLFSKAAITVINPDSGNVEKSMEIRGEGTKRINIILTEKLPKNIYEDFLLLADTGMTSGDQSLGEYLTLKGTLPYYDMQPWKYPMMKEIKKSGGPELSDYLDKKFIGRMPFSGERIYSLITNNIPLTPEQLMKKIELDKKISSNIASPHIRALIKSSKGQ